MVLWKGSKSTPFGDGPKGTPYGEEALCHFLLTTVWQSKIVTPYLNLLNKLIEGKNYPDLYFQLRICYRNLQTI